MNCTSITLTGISGECRKAVGGVEVVYVAAKKDVKEITLDDAEAKIVKIEMETSKKFETFEFHKNTASMTTETEAPDDDYPQFNTTLSMVFSKMETSKRVALMALALEDTVAIVKTQSGEYFYLGYNMGLLVNAMGGETGTLYSDKNQYTISLMDHAEQLPFEIAEGESFTVASIVNPAPTNA